MPKRNIFDDYDDDAPTPPAKTKPAKPTPAPKPVTKPAPVAIPAKPQPATQPTQTTRPGPASGPGATCPKCARTGYAPGGKTKCPDCDGRGWVAPPAVKPLPGLVAPPADGSAAKWIDDLAAILGPQAKSTDLLAVAIRMSRYDRDVILAAVRSKKGGAK